MNAEPTEWLRWHAGLAERTTDLPSIASSTSPGGRFTDDAREAVAHVITMLDALNRELNGPVPSEAIGPSAEMPRGAAVAMSRIVRRLTECSILAPDSHESEHFLRAAWRVEAAWGGVLAGDKDDILEAVDAEEAKRIGNLEWIGGPADLRRAKLRVSLACALYWFVIGCVAITVEYATADSLLVHDWVEWPGFGILGAVIGVCVSPSLWPLLSRSYRRWYTLLGCLIALAVVTISLLSEACGALLLGALAQVGTALILARVLPIRRDRMNAGRCPSCDYDMRVSHGGPCPECGWRRGVLPQRDSTGSSHVS